MSCFNLQALDLLMYATVACKLYQWGNAELGVTIGGPAGMIRNYSRSPISKIRKYGSLRGRPQKADEGVLVMGASNSISVLMADKGPIDSAFREARQGRHRY